ncbi:MAG: hypothetical protein V4641_09900 [Pseudomonadota bacterium]
MLIEIVNWAKYQPRHDIKSTSWFRLENTFWCDPMITPLDSDAKMVWIMLLSLASQHQSAGFQVDLKFVRRALGVRMKKLIESLEYFQGCGKIKISEDTASRTRNADVTLRTDGTDGTDAPYKGERPDPEPPPLGEHANLPIPEDPGADMRAATWLQKAIIFHNPAARKIRAIDLQRWADDFRQMREADGIAAEVIVEALTMLFEPEHPRYVIDPFWRIQIQSPAALRKHWDKVTAVINNPKQRAGGGYAI